MIDLGELKASITIDGSSDAKKGLEDVGKSTDGLESKFNKVIGTAKKVVTALAIGATVKAGLDKAIEAVNEFADAGDNIDKMSQKMSMSAEEFQRWSSIAGHNGSSIETYGNIMKKLADTTDKNAEAFSNLGISVENSDGSLRSQTEIFQDSILALSEMEDGTERNRLAQELFGKGYTDLLPLINGGTDSILEQIEASKEAVTMTDEQVKSAAAFKDAQQAMQEQIDKVKNTIVQHLVPALSSIMTWVSTELPKIIKQCQPVFDFISDGIGGIIEWVKQFIAQLIEFWNSNEELQKAVQEIWNAIVELFKASFDLVKSALDAFVKAFQMIWSKYGDTISLYIKTTFEVIKKVFKVAFDYVKDIFNVFSKAFQGDWKGCWEGVKTLFSNLVNNIKELCKTWLDGMIDIISNVGPKLYDAGKSIFTSLWDGIKDVWSNISNFVSEKVSWIADKLTFWNNSSSSMDSSKIDGSHRTGLNEVPTDGYMAQLHKGEMVLTQNEANRYRNNTDSNTNSANITMNFAGGVDQTTYKKLKADIDKGLKEMNYGKNAFRKGFIPNASAYSV